MVPLSLMCLQPSSLLSLRNSSQAAAAAKLDALRVAARQAVEERGLAAARAGNGEERARCERVLQAFSEHVTARDGAAKQGAKAEGVGEGEEDEGGALDALNALAQAAPPPRPRVGPARVPQAAARSLLDANKSLDDQFQAMQADKQKKKRKARGRPPGSGLSAFTAVSEEAAVEAAVVAVAEPRPKRARKPRRKKFEIEAGADEADLAEALGEPFMPDVGAQLSEGALQAEGVVQQAQVHGDGAVATGEEQAPMAPGAIGAPAAVAAAAVAAAASAEGVRGGVAKGAEGSLGGGAAGAPQPGAEGGPPAAQRQPSAADAIAASRAPGNAGADAAAAAVFAALAANEAKAKKEKKPRKPRKRKPSDKPAPPVIPRKELVDRIKQAMAEGYTQKEASQRVGVCVTVIKRICRACGVGRWPGRRVRALRARGEEEGGTPKGRDSAGAVSSAMTDAAEGGDDGGTEGAAMDTSAIAAAAANAAAAVAAAAPTDQALATIASGANGAHMTATQRAREVAAAKWTAEAVESQRAMEEAAAAWQPIGALPQEQPGEEPTAAAAAATAASATALAVADAAAAATLPAADLAVSVGAVPMECVTMPVPPTDGAAV